MTQNGGDRLDRIERALENLQQQMDNQVMLNADLRQSIAELRQTAESLLATTNLHQEGLEILAREMRDLRTDVRQLQDFERTTSATLERMGLILDFLTRQRTNGGNEE